MSNGIFFAKGMTVAFTDISLSFSAREFDQSQSTMTLKVGFDACIPWLEIALEHMTALNGLVANSEEVWSGEDAKAKGELLNNEFRGAMQAIVAAATAVDAFYSNVRSRVEIDKETVKSWQKGRASRPARIAETLRTAFTIKQENFETVSDYLHQIYQFRDKVVHPAGGLTPPVLHPGMKAGVEERFVTFRHYNALAIVHVVLELISQLAAKGHSTNKKLQDYCAYLEKLIGPLRERYPLPKLQPPSPNQTPS